MLHVHIDLILPAGLVAATAPNKDHLQCPFCVKSFRTEAELNIHTLTHQKVGVYLRLPWHPVELDNYIYCIMV